MTSNFDLLLLLFVNAFLLGSISMWWLRGAHQLELHNLGFEYKICHLFVKRPFGKFPNLSVPQFPHLQNKDNDSTYLIGSL